MLLSGVSADTLFAEIPLAQNDRVVISANIYGYIYPDTSALDAVFFLDFTVDDVNALGYAIPFTANFDNGISVDLADSASLTTFPFFYDFGYGTPPPPAAQLLIDGIAVGSTQPFSVTWMGQTYTGSMSRPVTDSLSFDWNNAYPVTIVHGGGIE